MSKSRFITAGLCAFAVLFASCNKKKVDQPVENAKEVTRQPRRHPKPEKVSAIEDALSSGSINVEQITEMSKRLPVLNDDLDEKSMRWLELSELV